MLGIGWQRLDRNARNTIPVAVAVICTLLGVTTWPVPFLGTVSPPLVLAALYYWATHRPDLFGPAPLFAIGLLNDILHGLPLGISSLLFVGGRELIIAQRKLFSGSGFITSLMGFCAFSFAFLAAEWLILSIYNWQIHPFMNAFVQFTLISCLYPLLCLIFMSLQKVITNELS